jgi:gluconolactonase
VHATGLGQPEGPFAFPDGHLVLVEMAEHRGCVTELGADGVRCREIARTGRPNAVVADGHGNLWVAESWPEPALLRIGPDHVVEVVATHADGRALRFPNDLVFAPDGMLYLTDSGMRLDEWAPHGRIRADFREAPIDGLVVRVDPRTAQTEVVDSGIAFANGIAVNPEGDLFANEMVTGHVYRYRWDPDSRRFGGRELFGATPATAPDADVSGFAGPDGMKFDRAGNLYCTVYGAGLVAVLDPSGAPLPPIHTRGRLPSNLVFATDGSCTAYVTECELGQVETFTAPHPGASTHAGSAAQE